MKAMTIFHDTIGIEKRRSNDLQTSRPIWRATLLGSAVALALSSTAAHAEAFKGDFNGDGFEDIVIGDSSAVVGGKYGAGRVLVIETDRFGLRPGVRAEAWDVDKLRNQGRAETNDGFGTTIAIGDFNGDGYDDLAVGAPNEDVGGYRNNGTVRVIYGTSDGLAKANNVILYGDDIDEYDHFGYALTVGDFNGDGYDDLAVGEPRLIFDVQGQGPSPFDGIVEVYFGASSGWSHSVILDRIDPGVAGNRNGGARFGEALAAGDIDGDGYDDLVASAPWDDYVFLGKTQTDAGSVSLMFGGSSGFGGRTIAFKDENEASNKNDNFGETLAVGDFDGDGYDDIAVGHPDERVGSKYAAGAVTIFSGTRRQNIGWMPLMRRIWTQDTTGVPGASESGDRLGTALTVGDFDNDGRDDLAIGIPYEDHERFFGDKKQAGSVLVLHGSYTGLYVDSTSDWDQDEPNVAGSVESNDYYGWALSAGDYNNDGIEDLLVGVYGEKISGYSGKGVIQLITGSPGGLQPAPGQVQTYYGGNLLGGYAIKNYGRVLP